MFGARGCIVILQIFGGLGVVWMFVLVLVVGCWFVDWFDLFALIGGSGLVVGSISDGRGLRGVAVWCLVCLWRCLGFVCLTVCCGCSLFGVYCVLWFTFGWCLWVCVGLRLGGCGWIFVVVCGRILGVCVAYLLDVAVLCIVVYLLWWVGVPGLIDLVLRFRTCVDVVCF